MLSAAAEDYIKAIYKLQEAASDGERAVATTDLAAAMDVTAASATGMVKRLATMGLLAHRSYRGVVLTEAGERVALEVIRHHRLLERYLRDVMGFSWEALHAEAELLEHHISEAFEDRLDELLGYPTHDPHGDPIPTRALTMPAATGHALDGARVGAALRVARVSDHDAALLGALEALGLLPGARLTLAARDADGTLHLTRAPGPPLALPPQTARHVFVDEAEG